MRSDEEPRFEAVGVHLFCHDRVLLVQRPAGKKHPLTWSAVGGKIEQGETPHDALIREVHEETSIALETVEHLSSRGYVHGGLAFTYHQFVGDVEAMPLVVLNDEHIGFGWFTIGEARGLDLMEDELELLEETIRKRSG